ncbi:hypothetical protein [Streptosporangium sp. CA-115845]|uniref:hypothetical protein n=1 Tax=Streptosporangium sp. CA-115845 TaxID=3240071 RepID=UPI003D90C5F2
MLEGTVTDSSGSNPYGPYGLPNPNMKPGVVDPRLTDPAFKMDHGKVTALGENVGKRASVMTELGNRTKAIDMHTLTFGVIGGGLNVVHRQVRDSAAEALVKAREVLESWNEALSGAAKNAKEAEAAGTGNGPPDSGGGGGAGAGAGAGIDPSDFGEGIDPSDFGGGAGEMPPFDPDAGGIGTQGPGDLPGVPGAGDMPTVPGADDLPGVPGSGDLPGVPGSGDLPTVPGADDLPRLPDLDRGQNGPGDIGSPDLGGLNAGTPGENTLNTQLAGYDPKTAVPDALANLPRTPGVPDLRTPGMDGSAMDRALSAGYGTGTTTGTGTGGGIGGGGAFSGGTGSGALGQGTGVGRGLGTGGMPMMPMAPMGGGMGGEGEGDRERSTWLSEEESVWGGDGDVAPAVIG